MHTKRNFDRAHRAVIASSTRRTRAPHGATHGTHAPEPARSAAQFLPPRLSLKSLREAAALCKGCDLYRNATQTVFGEGRRDATFVLVGEQPGDREDRIGRPFVGPAGGVLERALKQAGIAPDVVYITNAVKHFKWVARGKRRLHQRPREGEVDACLPWLAAEVEVIKPRALVCLGVTAARAAFGRSVRLKDYRGRFTATRLCERTLVTIHPSAVLRLLEPQRTLEFERLVADLEQLRDLV